MNVELLAAILNYTAHTAGLYLMLAVPAFIVRAVWWYAVFTREKKREDFVQPVEDAGAIAGRPVETRTLEYWHEPLCWWHIVLGLLFLRIAPMAPLIVLFGLVTRGWLSTPEYLQALLFAAAAAFFLLIWVRVVRAFQYTVDDEGIAFKPGISGTESMRWEDIDEAAVYGRRPIAAAVSGKAGDGKTRTVLLYNGFYKRGDFEAITRKLTGRPES